MTLPKVAIGNEVGTTVGLALGDNVGATDGLAEGAEPKIIVPELVNL